MALSKSEHVFFLSSDDCLDRFPSNKASDFRVELPELIRLPGVWICCLHSIAFKERIIDNIDIMTYICEEIYLFGSKHQALQTIAPSPSSMLEYTNPIWIDVSRDELKQLRLFIRTYNMTDAAFLNRTVKFTLVLKRVA